jgi:SpoVK/Ycf46/Vps4 family AAA+-type ATPase
MSFYWWYLPNVWCPDKMGFLIIQNDGYELDKKVVVIADTSRKQDHDPAATRYIS